MTFVIGGHLGDDGGVVLHDYLGSGNRMGRLIQHRATDGSGVLRLRHRRQSRAKNNADPSKYTSASTIHVLHSESLPTSELIRSSSDQQTATCHSSHARCIFRLFPRLVEQVIG